MVKDALRGITVMLDEDAIIHVDRGNYTVLTEGLGGADVPIIRVADIYDYTIEYQPYIEYAADYYKKILDGWIDVRYHRMPGLLIGACTAINQGSVGIRMCEEITAGTAGSTALSWVQTGPNEWGVFSNCYFHASHHALNGGMDGRFLAVHELGHTFGNLPHRTEEPHSAMSAVGAYAWDYLVDFEIAAIKALLPPWDITEDVPRQLGGSDPPPMCDLPREG